MRIEQLVSKTIKAIHDGVTAADVALPAGTISHGKLQLIEFTIWATPTEDGMSITSVDTKGAVRFSFVVPMFL